MTCYRVLVVDDQPGQTKELFARLFTGDRHFNYTQVQSPNDFFKADIASFDVVLLDINLDDWGITLSEALAIVGNYCPVVLASRFWDKERTHDRISEALAGVKNVRFIATLVLKNLGESDWENHAESIRGQLRLAIERERRRGLLDLKKNDPVRILHLSDPQYGDPGGDDWAAYVEDEIGQFILGSLDLEIHFIAITGDIAYSGECNQYAVAEQKLTTLIQHFFPNRSDWRERILLVPGNHDVNLRLAAADRININIKGPDLFIKCDTKKSQNDFPNRRFALAPYRDFAWRLTGDPNWKDSEELCWISDSFRHVGLRFFLLNSTATIDCRHPQRPGFPLNTMDPLGGKDLIGEQPFGIGFSHHGPPEIKNTGVDVLTEWPRSSKFLKTRGIKLFVHGHGHSRMVERFNLAKQTADFKGGKIRSGEILRVMAPTTHLNGEKRPSNERRGFNLITLSRSYGKVDKITVDSYEFYDDGIKLADGFPRDYFV